jgi:hypothetical protein
MAHEREQKTELARPAQRAVIDERLRALVRTLAKMAAEADYKASKAQTSHPPKGSSS